MRYLCFCFPSESLLFTLILTSSPLNGLLLTLNVPSGFVPMSAVSSGHPVSWGCYVARAKCVARKEGEGYIQMGEFMHV